jgi:TrmH family RNA methyltransferase
MKLVSSPENPLFRQVQALMRSGRDRDDSGLAVIEGTHLVRSFLHSKGQPPHLTVFCADQSDHPDLAQLGLELPMDRKVAFSPKLFSRLSPVGGGNAVLAIIPLHESSPREVLRLQGLQLWLDRVQDPGNVGSIIRSAAASGATAVVLGPGSADAWSPKCLRGGMGGHFAIEVCRSLQPLSDVGLEFEGRILAASAAADVSLYETDLSGSVAILLGSEGHGISAELERLARTRFRIPTRDAVESLNVGAAAAVICFERARRLRVPGS